MGPLDLVAVACAVGLAVVLLISGIAKLLDRDGTRDAVEALGVPAGARRLVAAALAPLELVIALLLVVPATGRVGSTAAVGLLAAFTGVVVVNLLAGRRPRCGCFGGLGSSDVSWRTMSRNALLLGMAGLSFAPRAEPTIGPVLAGAVAATLVVGGERLLSSRAGAARDREDAQLWDAPLDPVVRRLAPAFTLADVGGRTVTLDALLSGGRPVLLVFLRSGCGSCRTLAPALVRWHLRFADRLEVVVAATGGREAVRGTLGDTTPLPVLLLPDDTLLDAYGAHGSPVAALIAPDGRLDGPVAAGSAGVRPLLAHALGAPSEEVRPLRPQDVDLASAPAPLPTVTRTDVDEGCVLVDESTGASITADALGALVWQCLDGRSPLEEIADDLAVVFDADPDVVRLDVLRVVGAAASAGLVSATAPHHAVP